MYGVQVRTKRYHVYLTVVLRIAWWHASVREHGTFEGTWQAVDHLSVLVKLLYAGASVFHKPDYLVRHRVSPRLILRVFRYIFVA